MHDADAVTAHILRHAEPGSVILMHDLTDSSVTAALRVIDALQAQGYEFLTVFLNIILRKRFSVFLCFCKRVEVEV